MYTDQYPGGSQSISEGFVHFKFRGYIIGDIRAIRQERGPFIFRTPLTKLHFVLTTRTVVIITEVDDCCPAGWQDAKSTDDISKGVKNNDYDENDIGGGW